MLIRCDEVIVKFVKPGNQGSRIMTSMGPSFAKYLSVRAGDKFLIVQFCDAQDNPVKQIAYNLSEVLEFSCEGYHPSPNKDLP